MKSIEANGLNVLFVVALSEGLGLVIKDISSVNACGLLVILLCSIGISLPPPVDEIVVSFIDDVSPIKASGLFVELFGSVDILPLLIALSVDGKILELLC